MADHNILELLLFYGIPYRDTNDAAHRLTEKFGSLSGVLEAPVEELMQTDGIGENTAVLIKLVRDIAVKYNAEKLNPSGVSAGEELNAVLTAVFSCEPRECMYLVSLTSDGTVIRTVRLSEGTPDTVRLDNRLLAEVALRQNCSSIILAHNHPCGFAVPSQADAAATAEISALLKQLGIHLADHIIVSGKDCFSMASSTKYADIFRQEF